jgi:hypothetical protein
MVEKVAQRGVGNHFTTMRSTKASIIKADRASQIMRRDREGIPRRSRIHGKKEILAGVHFYIRKT